MSFEQIWNFLYKVNAISILVFPIHGKMAFIWKGFPDLVQQPFTLPPPLLPNYAGINPITWVISLKETAKSTAEDFKLPSNDLIRKTYILHDDFTEGYGGYAGVSSVIEHRTLNMSTELHMETNVGGYVQCQVTGLNTMIMSSHENSYWNFPLYHNLDCVLYIIYWTKAMTLVSE